MAATGNVMIGNADSRSNLEPPYGMGVDEIAALSLLSDSGAWLSTTGPAPVSFQLSKQSKIYEEFM